MFDQTEAFSLCRIVSGPESSPMLVHASIAINPLKTAELRQHQLMVYLTLVDSSVKTEVTFLCPLLMRPTEICACSWNGANDFTAQIFNQKITGVTRQLQQRQARRQQLWSKQPFIQHFSIKLSFLNFPCGSQDVPFYVNTSAWPDFRMLVSDEKGVWDPAYNQCNLSLCPSSLTGDWR